MNREEKYLVIDDISGRIPHGVVFKTDWGNKTLKGIQYDYANTLLYFGVCNFTNKVIETYVSEVKPYLFPMTSMTEEKRKYIFSFFPFFLNLIHLKKFSKHYCNFTKIMIYYKHINAKEIMT